MIRPQTKENQSIFCPREKIGTIIKQRRLLHRKGRKKGVNNEMMG
jgi:hypothetical protein